MTKIFIEFRIKFFALGGGMKIIIQMTDILGQALNSDPGSKLGEVQHDG
ncbi:MAG: hypothetical protein ACI9O0_000089 [Paracoccaceae bacterium]|jgi:hypothetical protein